MCIIIIICMQQKLYSMESTFCCTSGSHLELTLNEHCMRLWEGLCKHQPDSTMSNDPHLNDFFSVSKL